MNTIPTNPLSTRMRWRNTYLRWSNCLRLWRTHNYFKKLAFLVFHTSDFATVAEKVSCGSLLSFAFKVCFVDVVRNLWRQSGTYTPTLTFGLWGRGFKNTLYMYMYMFLLLLNFLVTKQDQGCDLPSLKMSRFFVCDVMLRNKSLIEIREKFKYVKQNTRALDDLQCETMIKLFKEMGTKNDPSARRQSSPSHTAFDILHK